MALLQKESELQEIVKLVGPDALPPRERAFLESARMIREDFLQQSAFHEVDTYCSSKKQYKILKIILKVSDEFQNAIEKNVLMEDIMKTKTFENVARLKTVPIEEFEKRFAEAEKVIDKEFSKLIAGGN
jgi:V/A-type H+-transporting ATPase subunit A